MPEIDENLRQWNAEYSWDEQGDEWSHAWGGTSLMWWGTLRPRLHAFLPAPTILEIAPGFGRWTQFLKDECERLVLVDLSERCIESCRARFAAEPSLEYHVNDGRSLEMVADGSVDLAFSFDSLVHAETDVIEAYVQQLARKLSPGGIGFIHHSNMGAYPGSAALADRVPEALRRRLVGRHVLINTYSWRARSVTADLVLEQCRAAGLRCLGQELVNWYYGFQLIDCITVFTRAEGGDAGAEPVRVRNRGFMREARALQRIAPLYARPSSKS